MPSSKPSMPDSGRGPRSRSSHRQPSSSTNPSAAKHASTSSSSNNNNNGRTRSSKHSSTSHSPHPKPSLPPSKSEPKPTKHQSLQPTTRDAQRIPLQSRTNSAPLVPQVDSEQNATSEPRKTPVPVEETPRDSISDDPFFKRYANPDQSLGKPSKRSMADQRFDKEKPREPPTINIGLVGVEKVGKTTFAQNALDVHGRPPLFKTRKLDVENNPYTLRLYELSLNDLDISADRIAWPKTKDEVEIPAIDGIILVYDVMNPDSLPPLRQALTPLQGSNLPVLLVSAKCDKPRLSREIDVDVVEEKARLLIEGIHLAQVTCDESETHKSSLSNLFNEIIDMRKDPQNHSRSRPSETNKEPRKPSPSPQPSLRHVRAMSDLSGASLKPAGAGKDESSMNDETATVKRNLELRDGTRTPPRRTKSADAGSHLRIETTIPIPQPAKEAVARTFLDLEDSPKVERFQIPDSRTPRTPAGRLYPATPSEPQYYTFDELVAKLLAPPTSKADTKFAIVFLAFYRLFASPSRLLEAIIAHFDAMANNSIFTITPDQNAQDRDLLILDQWVNAYPGDFAFAAPRRRLRKFIAQVEQCDKLKASIDPISVALDKAVEDDDTAWGCADDEPTSFRHRGDTFLSTSSLDPVDLANNLQRQETKTKVQDISPEYDAQLIFSGDSTLTLTAMGPDSNSSSQTILNVAESAQRQAALLVPNPTIQISKGYWRALVAQPDNTIANELTRIDWIMFSAIRPRDLIRHVTVPPEERARFPSLENVSRMIDHFNHIAYWVTNMILFRDKPKHRVQALEKFMRVARRLREMNNYNSLGAIVAGVQGTAVHRLAATKELLNPSVARDWMKIEILMSTAKGHAAYRLAWENTTGGRVPYLPLHRRDLMVAGASSKTFVTGSHEAKVLRSASSDLNDAPPIPIGSPSGDDDVTYDDAESTDASSVVSGESATETKQPDEHASPQSTNGASLADSPASPTPTSASNPTISPPPAAAAGAATPDKDKAAKINWPKFQVMGNVLHAIQRAQSSPYAEFAPCEDVRTLLLQLDLTTDDDELFERSVAVEPAGGVASGIGSGLGRAESAGGGGLGMTPATMEGMKRKLQGLGWTGRGA